MELSYTESTRMGGGQSLRKRPARPPSPQFDSIATELKIRSRWVCWRFGKSRPNGRFMKVPYGPNGRPCDCTNSKAWMSFDQASLTYHRGGYDGIGFVLGDGVCGLDVDHCRDGDIMEPQAAHYLQ